MLLYRELNIPQLVSYLFVLMVHGFSVGYCQWIGLVLFALIISKLVL